MAKIAEIKPITNRLTQLRNDMAYSVITGNYKAFKTATKEHAKLAVDNFELAKTIKTPKVKVPLFSKYGLNMAKVWFLNLFRIKTPAERKLKIMSKLEKANQDLAEFLN